MSDLAYLFAQTFALSGTQNWIVSDDDRDEDYVNMNSGGGTRYYRQVAARTASAARTVTDPGDFLWWVGSVLGDQWRVEMRPNGRVRITFLGTTEGEIDLGGSITVAWLLGFNLSIGGPLLSFPTTGSYVDTPCIPSHVIVAEQFWPDTGWTRRGQRIAGVEMPDGTVTAWSDRKQGLTREGDIGLIPRDWVFAQPIEAGSPMYPASGVDTERLLTPSVGEPGQEPPWSVLDQMGNQVGQRWGVLFGTLQAVLAGTDTKFDVVSVRLDSIRAESSNRPTSAAYDGRWQQSIAFRFITRSTRS